MGRLNGWTPMVAFLEAFMGWLKEYKKALKAQLRVVKDEVAVVKDLLAIYNDLIKDFNKIMNVFRPVVDAVNAFESGVTQITRDILQIFSDIGHDVVIGVDNVKNVYESVKKHIQKDEDKAIEALHQVLQGASRAVHKLVHDEKCLLQDVNQLMDDVKKAIDALKPLEGGDASVPASFEDTLQSSFRK